MEEDAPLSFRPLHTTLLMRRSPERSALCGCRSIRLSQLFKAPAFVESNLSKPVADNFLFEAIAREAAVFGSFVEVESALSYSGAAESAPYVVRYGSGESGEIDEV